MAGGDDMTYTMRRLPRGTTLHFTVRTSKEFRVRMTLAVWLIKLAAWVLNAGVEVDQVVDADL